MTRPTNKIGRLIAFGPVLLITALVPITLMGFISTSGEKHSTDDAVLNIDVLMKRVTKLNEKKQHQKAIETLLAAIDQEKDDPLMRALLVQTFDMFLEDEIKSGQKDIEKNPKNKGSYIRVSGAFELLGDNQRAMEVLLKGVQNNIKSSELWMKVARLELKANRDMEALDVFREVTRIDSKNSVAFNNAAYILARADKSSAKDLKEAEKFANTARKLEPKNPEYLDTLAVVYHKQGNQKMALSVMEQAIKLAPKKDEFKNQLKQFKEEASFVAE